MSKGKRMDINPKPIEQAIEFLDEHFDTIQSVTEWAEAMGYSRTLFWKAFDSHFKVTPRSKYIKKKMEVLCIFFNENSECKNREAAEVIHLNNGDALYKFVKRHFGCSTTELRIICASKAEW